MHKNILSKQSGCNVESGFKLTRVLSLVVVQVSCLTLCSYSSYINNFAAVISFQLKRIMPMVAKDKISSVASKSYI